MRCHASGRDHRCLGVHGRRAAAPRRPASRRSRSSSPPATRRPASCRRPVPVARRSPTRTSCSSRSTRRSADGLDVVFLGLPHEASMALAPQLVGSVGCVVDLSAAYRLKDAAQYPAFYGFEHDQPELLAEAVFGLPELHRAELKGARLIATPGCYVTAATLALRPLVDAGLIETDGHRSSTPLTGITGAGRKADRHQRVHHRRRELHRLRPARPPPHAGDGAGDRRPAAVHAAPRRR